MYHWIVEVIKLKSIERKHDHTGCTLWKGRCTVIPLTRHCFIDGKGVQSCRTNDEDDVVYTDLRAASNGDESSDSDESESDDDEHSLNNHINDSHYRPHFSTRK